MRISVSLGALSIALASVASAPTHGAAAQVETVTTISGDVVRYEPGRVIVVRGSDGKEVAYTLSPRVALPAQVKVGQRVTLHTERSADGSPTTVSRIVTTSVTPQGNVQTTTDETRTTAAGATTKSRITTISGEVMQYEPGRTIVVREPGREVVTYTLAPDASVPADIQVGKTVTLYAEPEADGNTSTVRRVLSTSVTPEGGTKSTTEETRTSASGSTTTTTTTSIAGTVEAYTAGKSITLLRSDGTRVTYTITSQSKVPQSVLIGKPITIVPVDPREYVVRTITVREP